jgi:hypothetical protein
MNFARLGTVLLATLLALAASAGAEEPPNYTFEPKPPGTIVQSQLVYLAGETMHSQWRAVLSKAPVGSAGNRTFYQWYLSIYQIGGTTYRLRYRSPRRTIPFSTVTKAAGANMWFPIQDGSIAGVGELMGAGAQEVVVASHEAGADCGTARVDVFFQDAAMNAIMPTLSVTNYCSLSAKVVNDASGVSLAITGPYYAANAPVCCPTKPKVTAIFRFHGGTWSQTPRYFTIVKQP